MPSQTELLYSLDLENEVVGITKFCVHPPHWFRHKTRVGGTKKVDIDKIRSLNPDLVLANEEENTKEDIDAISVFCPVWVSCIRNVDDAMEMIASVSVICNREIIGRQLLKDILIAMQKSKSGQRKKYRTLYLIWNDPYMAAGTDTFISDMMRIADFENLCNSKRYPVYTPGELVALQPDVLLLSSEPFPFREKHRAALQLLLPRTKIVFADGEFFSWYGSRMLGAFDYFSALHEDLEKL